MSTGGFNLNQLRTARLLEMWHAELESVQKGMLPDARISRELFRRVAFLKRDISSDRVAQNSEGRLAHDGLFSLHHDQFSGWIRRISPDFSVSEIEEVIEIVSESVWKSFGPKQYANALGTRNPGFDYLRVCLIHAARRYWRRRHSDIENEDLLMALNSSIPDKVKLHTYRILEETCKDELDHKIARLFYIEWMAPRDIANELGLPVGTIHTRKRLLKDRLKSNKTLSTIWSSYFSEESKTG